MKKDTRIAVWMGGLSSEREGSLTSGDAVLQALVELGYDAFAVDVDRHVAAVLEAEDVDAAFIALHGTYGEDGAIQGLLEVMGIPYTGSGITASAMAMNKAISRLVLEHQGIPVPASVVSRGDRIGPEDLPFGLPCIVKPCSEGSSVGITIVREAAALNAAVRHAGSFGPEVIVEAFIDGHEINVGILDDCALGAVEIVPARPFYDFTAKYEDHATKYIYPAPLDEDRYGKILDLGLRAHVALGCAGATRVDLIVDGSGRPFVLEVNTLPGMTQTSLMPKIARGEGIEFNELVERILASADAGGLKQGVQP